MKRIVECIHCQKVIFESAREGDIWVCPHCSRRFHNDQLEEFDRFQREFERRQHEQRIWEDIQAKEALRRQISDDEPNG